MIKFRDLFLQKHQTILEAMAVIEKQALQIALVVDEKDVLIAAVTDGDVRRGILKGVSLQDPVEKVMNTNPTTVALDVGNEEILRLMHAKNIDRVPVIDEEGRVVDLKILDRLVKVPDSKPHTVVLMAGGLGTRLGALTRQCPKPMLKVGSKPILEIILENFIEHGFKNFYISVNFMAEMIEDYFQDGSPWKVNIKYLKEDKKLGTAGSLSLLPEATKAPLIVMNGDLLTKVNFSKLIEHHEQSEQSATMCVRKYDFEVPYGVVEVQDHNISNIVEKPVQSFFVSAGVYVLNPEVLSLIPKNESIDMPEVFTKLMSRKKSAGVFPIHEYWIDVGRKDDFDQANFDFREQKIAAKSSTTGKKK